MSIPSPFTAVRNTPNKSVRQNVPRRGVVPHHAAMTSLSGLRNLAMGGKQVSANAIVKDDAAENLIPEGYRAWSLSSAWGDSSFRSIECANESTNGWTISDKSLWTIARLIAYWAEQDGFYPHRNGDPKTWTVVGHREMYTIHGISYPTACPGGMDLNLVTRRAQQLLAGSSFAGDTGTIIEEADVAVHKTFQNTTDFYIRPGFQRFPWQSSPREENLAVGTGAGLFDVLLNFYLTEFAVDAQVEGRLVVQDAATGAERHQYLFTVDGSVSGEVRAAVPARVVVPPKSRLFLELRTSAGADPRLDVWGADIAVLTVS